MSCPDYELQLVELLDGELPPAERRQVLLHLEQCAVCRALYAQLEQGASAFQSLRPQASPDSAHMISGPLLRRAARRTWSRRALALAAGIALILLGTLPLRRSLHAPPPASPPVSSPAAGPPASIRALCDDSADASVDVDCHLSRACATPDGCQASRGWLLTTEAL